MKKLWDERYKVSEYIYGLQPNVFLKEYIDKNNPGNILLPGDGEGRNSVYSVKKGWNVTAFDYSSSAKQKALELSKKNNVNINYYTSDIESFRARDKFDLIAIIYLHLPEKERVSFHKKLTNFLNPGGRILLECFSKEQINNNSGGPKNVELLYSLEAIRHDFENLKINYLELLEIKLNEGVLHQGKASVIRMLAENI